MRIILVLPDHRKAASLVSKTDSPSMQKKELRQRLCSHRSHLTSEESQQAAYNLCQQVLRAKLIPARAIVGGYLIMQGEVDPYPLLESLLTQGHRCCVPHVFKNTRVMKFQELTREGLLQNFIIPGVLIIPMVAFDTRGYRLGRGGGHYDATLDSLRTTGHLLTIGVAFDWQEVEAIPYEEHDQRMDYIVTPTRIFEFV